MMNRGQVPNNNINYGYNPQVVPGNAYGYQVANQPAVVYQQVQQNPNNAYQNGNTYGVTFY